MKNIIFTAHATGNIPKRGFTKEEVIETIQSEQWQAADFGKLECRRDFIYDQKWNGKIYHTKQVRPIFVEKEDQIVVITVYTYYF